MIFYFIFPLTSLSGILAKNYWLKKFLKVLFVFCKCWQAPQSKPRRGGVGGGGISASVGLQLDHCIQRSPIIKML
jgi:hypothetical protein